VPNENGRKPSPCHPLPTDSAGGVLRSDESSTAPEGVQCVGESEDARTVYPAS